MSPKERLKEKLAPLAGPMLLEAKIDLLQQTLKSLDEEEKIELANSITRFLHSAEWAFQQMSISLGQLAEVLRGAQHDFKRLGDWIAEPEEVAIKKDQGTEQG